MFARNRADILSWFISFQKKILEILLRNDINKNKELFDKLATL